MNNDLRYHPSRDQQALASTFNESLAELLPVGRLHAAYEESEVTWANLEALGLFGIAVREEDGGSGLGSTEEALIVMELGHQLAAPAILATIGATHSVGYAGRGSVLSGRRVAMAYGRDARIVVVDDSSTDLLLVRDGSNTAIHQRPTDCVPIDDYLWSARLYECSVESEPVARYEERGVLRLRLLDAAALAGMAATAVRMGVEYSAIRTQFGRPIGSFQAVKHQCANMAISARCARDQVCFAAVALDQGRPDAALQVDCALVVAGNAALENAGRNIQVHGGMGFSDEADPHLVLKRAQLLIAVAGGISAAIDRIANASAAGAGG